MVYFLEICHFSYEGEVLEIVKSFKYLGIVFTAGGSFLETQNTLAGQAQKAIFKLNKYLYKFTFISQEHKLELFDKLISPIEFTCSFVKKQKNIGRQKKTQNNNNNNNNKQNKTKKNKTKNNNKKQQQQNKKKQKKKKQK